jgi:4Fe-4S ferredoxin
VPVSDAKAECKEPNLLVPVIDRHRCEGKEDCVRVCPYDVFEIRVLDEKQRAELPFFPRLKVRFHGWKQAFAVRAADCHACGKCVEACPEKAIKLARAPSVAS